MVIFTKVYGKMVSNMEKEAMNGIMEIVTKAIFGKTNDKGKQLFITRKVGDMKDIGKMIKSMGKEYFSITKGPLKYLITD